jgi:uncharacterized protein YndB with AHSA1/START domain
MTGSPGPHDTPRATLHTVDDRPVLRFERLLRHDPDTVWRAVTDPAEMAHWFPATVETEPRVGAAMRFTFEGGDAPTSGEILELDPPKVFAFRWNEDVLRFEVVAREHGSLLVFTHTLGGDWVGRLAAGRNAAGWDVCLAALQARLAGEEFAQPTDWADRIGSYVAEFGLAEGEVHETGEGFVVRFARDLVWRPVEEVWALLVEQHDVEVGAPPPMRSANDYARAGSVAAVEAPRLLEYEWLHDGAAAGRVRWELTHDPAQGTRVELTQTVPTRLSVLLPSVLAAWQTHLELMFTAVLGDVRPWPQGRVEELERMYAARLG